ncbi:hypothetical protein BCONGLO52_08040 [Brachybacterium conglomeratum]|uniref:Uncharacterized protein n=1 Tax=Brachybacterium conglomeratum TaxID=47846 RepID=A0ABQ5RDJ6_9MICO|nr:hypothetical protein BCONGLO52_08040 [Brachybacterium conglomeratum]GLK05860.1 hypothetical protein GCM10017597_26600 [Brachybacterium conglomeratum]
MRVTGEDIGVSILGVGRAGDTAPERRSTAERGSGEVVPPGSCARRDDRLYNVANMLPQACLPVNGVPPLPGFCRNGTPAAR